MESKLSGKQRASLRAEANQMETIFQLGKGGITALFIKQVEDALEKREMIKLRVLENSEYSAKEAAAEISAAIHAEVIQVIGSRFVLYKQNKNPQKRIYYV